MKLSRISMALSAAIIVGISGSANAVVGTGISPTAMLPIAQVATGMGTSAAITALAITKAATDASASIASSSGSVTQAIVQTSMKNSMDDARLASMSSKMEMDYQSELANKKIEAQRSGKVGMVKEDVEYVLKFLNDPKYSKLNTTELVAFAKRNIDGKEIIVAPRTDKGNKCSGGKCGFQKKIQLSQILEYYAPLCADNKRAHYKQDLLNKAQMNTKIASAREVKNMVSNTSSVATAHNRLKRDLEISCTPEMLKIGACGHIVSSKEEYVKAVLANKIIPNGNVSALNLYSPTSVGGFGYVDMNNPNDVRMMNDFASTALEHTNNGGAGVPTIVDTYRNSSQLKSALSFVDNVVNIGAVSNQPVANRMGIGSSKFQNRFLSRIATLDLAKNVMGGSVAERRGRRLSSYDTNREDFVKEYDDGASYIDIERYGIQKDLNKFSPQNIQNLQAMTDKQITIEMYKSQAKANALLWKRIRQAEQESLLLASLVAAEANSPDNIRYINSIDN
ncbi:hypothetical protein [Photobacterium damselae]|uniref:hypothetical protein n=1 Tax=Photobacterium damselae TaxID=38293 RepID=UPI0040690134